jgi:hypothetical protein
MFKAQTLNLPNCHPSGCTCLLSTQHEPQASATPYTISTQHNQKKSISSRSGNLVRICAHMALPCAARSNSMAQKCSSVCVVSPPFFPCTLTTWNFKGPRNDWQNLLLLVHNHSKVGLWVVDDYYRDKVLAKIAEKGLKPSDLAS